MSTPSTMLALPAEGVIPTVFNRTPVDLVLSSGGQIVAHLPSLARTPRFWDAVGPLEVRIKGAPPASPPHATFAQGSGPTVVEAGDLVESGPMSTRTMLTRQNVRWENRTTQQVVLTWARGADFTVASVPPGGHLDRSVDVGQLFHVQSESGAIVATRYFDTAPPLVSIYDRSPEPSQPPLTVSITDDFVRSLARLDNWKDELPSPMPNGAAVELVGSARPKPKPESRDYLVISEHLNHKRDYFNGRFDVDVSTVRIAGVKLVWDVNKPELGLVKYQGERVNDIERLDIHADHVVIASRVRFPGTEVVIHARLLEFVGDGCIDTTPLSITTPARSAKHDKTGRPIDAKGKPTYVAADGIDGQDGGNVTLHIKQLVLPPSTATPRIVARGSRGQEAERGGLKDYTPAPGRAPNKNMTPVDPEDVMGAFRSAFLSAREVWDWRWPGEAQYPQHATMPDQSSPFRLAKDGNVVQLYVVAHDDSMFFTSDAFRFPDGKRFHANGRSDNGQMAIDGARFANPDEAVPGDGEDAYPGGSPGNGGTGGAVACSLGAHTLGGVVDNAGGAPGPETPGIDGGPPGTPELSYTVLMDAVRRTPPIESSRAPSVTITSHATKPGKSAPARQGDQGAAGTIDGVDGSWVSPLLVGAVIECARDAHRAGFLEMAAALIAPYYRDMPDHIELQPELATQAIVIGAMAQNLRHNLDFYGNPPGWLPRLNLSTNFATFRDLRKVALKLLYYAIVMTDKYEQLEDRATLAEMAAQALQAEREAAVEELKGAVNAIGAARLHLHDISQKVLDKQNEMDLLKTFTENEALNIAERQQVYNAVCKVIGQTMRAFPVGQPYLSLGGDLVLAAGDIDFTDPKNINKSIAGSLTKVGGKVESFLSTNGDLISDDVMRDLNKKVKFQATVGKALDDQVASAVGSAKNVETQIKTLNTAIIADWTADMEAAIAPAKETLTALEAEIKLASDPRKLADLEATKTRLEDYFADRGGVATVNKQREDLEAGIKHWQGLIDAAKKDVTATGDKRVADLETQQKALVAQRKLIDDLKEKQADAIATNTELKEKQTTQKAMVKDVLGRMKGIGGGIAGIGQAISTLSTPLTTDDDKVQALAASMLDDPVKQQRWQAMERDFTVLEERQRTALAKLVSAQQAVSTSIAQIAESLEAQAGLSRQSQLFDSALDARTLQYLRGMKQRALDTLRWTMYNLMMSYRYEVLEDVPDAFFDYEIIVDRLQALESTQANDADGVTFNPPKEAAFLATHDTALKDLLVGMATTMLLKRQRQDNDIANSHTVTLPGSMLDELGMRRQVTFNLVKDLEMGNFSWRRARIAQIKLDAFEIETTNLDAKSLRVTFRHSGQSVLLGKRNANDYRYYYFQKAPDDDPISWGFNYDHGRRVITADAPDTRNDALLNDVINEAGGSGKIKFAEYLPGYFGDITLHITGGMQPTKPDQTFKVTKVMFKVDYLMQNERFA